MLKRRKRRKENVNFFIGFLTKNKCFFRRIFGKKIKKSVKERKFLKKERRKRKNVEKYFLKEGTKAVRAGQTGAAVTVCGCIKGAKNSLNKQIRYIRSAQKNRHLFQNACFFYAKI